MIIINLRGRLGNQMFQYALAKYLSIQLDSKIFIDYSDLGNTFISNTKRNYELDIFLDKIPPIPKWQLFRVRLALKLKGIKKIPLFLINLIANCRIFQEKTLSYNTEINQLSGNLFLIGYWQTEKYFAEVEKQIRIDFTFPPFQLKKNIKLTNKISITNAIGIHVRRGDYVNSKMFGNCSLLYYQKAISYIRKKVEQPHFFIFSDDPEWCKENFKLLNVIFIDWNTGKHSFRDMHLMSLCQHNIIANSTFSWWGAWLNQNPNKIVITPQRWFADENMLAQCGDRIPDKWIQM